ncbi:MAG: peptidoglycan-binding protein [Oscillospiraceae bacterium]|nr:peptidoglycan-binding protein [Oscillospiraceae bacterium]
MRPAESFIGQPIRSLQTMLRVIAENDPSHVPIIPDGIYGPETVRAVSKFQRIHGLPVTGVTDQTTWENVVSVYEPALIEQDAAFPLDIILNPKQVIRKGEYHPNLYLAQAMLAVLSEVYQSISKPPVSGLLDDATEDALASFQSLSGLPMSGQLDKHTWKHLALQYPLAASLSFPLPGEKRQIHSL